MNSAYLFLIGSMVCLGVSTIFFEKSTLSIGAYNTTLLYYISGTVLSLLLFFFVKKTPIAAISDLKWVFLASVFLFSSVYLFTLSLQKIDVSIAATVRALSFIVPVLVSFYFSSESISPKQVVGILMGVVAIICMK